MHMNMESYNWIFLTFFAVVMVGVIGILVWGYKMTKHK
jgi:hypothetical protein